MLIFLLLSCTNPTVAEPSTTMVRIAAGSFVLGRDDEGHQDQGPAHGVVISSFYLDETLVRVADFRQYVNQSGAVTSAERAGFAKTSVEGMDDWDWLNTPGATWRQPWGPDSELSRQTDDLPVVQVSWDDANAYCLHYGKRLPTEAEWVYAMAAGTSGTRYAWGNHETNEKGQYLLNFWQGRDHKKNTRADGYLYRSPVKAFPANAWGLYDSVGNTWQWTQDWYGADTFEQQRSGATDPQGPPDGWAKVARGGSWWCSDTACSAYGLFKRGKSKPGAAFPNNGFRCARNAN